jgi:hypothetical protein
MFWTIYIICFLIIFIIIYSDGNLRNQKGRFLVSLAQAIFYGFGLTYLIFQVLLILKVITKIF